MRLWSVHPRFLDVKGLVALWREGLLARAVLRGQTRGYRQHPQLERFKVRRNPLAAIDCYLSRVLDESRGRGYEFDASKITYRRCRHAPLHVTALQLQYEWRHLLVKLKQRDAGRWAREHGLLPQPHPCFKTVPGPIADWERISDDPWATRRQAKALHLANDQTGPISDP
jgi:hypothetical protein